MIMLVKTCCAIFSIMVQIKNGLLLHFQILELFDSERNAVLRDVTVNMRLRFVSQSFE